MRFMQNRPFAANKAVSTALTLGLIVGVNACLSPLAVLARTSDLSALNGPAVFASEAAVGKEALHFGEGFKQMTPDQSKQAEALIKELDTIPKSKNKSIDRPGQEIGARGQQTIQCWTTRACFEQMARDVRFGTRYQIL